MPTDCSRGGRRLGRNGILDAALQDRLDFLLAMTQGRLAAKAFEQTVTAVAWKTRPSWYVVTTADRVVSPDLRAFLAKRMNAATTKLDASHVSLLSRPAGVVAVMEDAISTVMGQLHSLTPEVRVPLCE
jgi:pimeloyl-ACP methyl ester carboxylesterase